MRVGLHGKPATQPAPALQPARQAFQASQASLQEASQASLPDHCPGSPPDSQVSLPASQASLRGSLADS